MGYKPVEFYDMTIDECECLFKGYAEKVKDEKANLRNVALIVSEVVNRTMGGSGVYENVIGMWPIYEGEGKPDKADPLMDREERKRILAYHREKTEKNG